MMRGGTRKKIAQSKAGTGRKEKSRHVQEPLRKHGKCTRLLKKRKGKTRKTSVSSAFPMFTVTISKRRSREVNSRCFVYELERVRPY